LIVQIYELVTADALFHYNIFATKDDILLKMVKVCGPAPDCLLEKSEALKHIINNEYRMRTRIRTLVADSR
jgi:hypothetical protein